jgi:4-carboxymuconolactone decarboxylase
MAPRIPPLPPEERDERTAELVASLRIPAEDGGEPKELNLFSTLARNPRVLKRFTQLGGVLLSGEVGARERELLILRTGWNTQAEYEWGQHVLMGKQAGLTDEEIRNVTLPMADSDWSEHDQGLLRAADELHGESQVSDTAWRILAEHYSEAGLIEVCMIVGYYHLVGFTLNSLGVEREPGVPGFPY